MQRFVQDPEPPSEEEPMVTSRPKEWSTWIAWSRASRLPPLEWSSSIRPLSDLRRVSRVTCRTHDRRAYPSSWPDRICEVPRLRQWLDCPSVVGTAGPSFDISSVLQKWPPFSRRMDWRLPAAFGELHDRWCRRLSGSYIGAQSARHRRLTYFRMGFLSYAPLGDIYPVSPL